MIKCPTCGMVLDREDIYAEDEFGLCPFCEKEFNIEK